MDVLLELGLLVLLTAFAGLVAAKARFPPVLALLLVGVVAGKHGLGLLAGDSGGIIDLFAELGAVLLLFAIGAEFSLSKLLNFGLRVVFIGITKLAIVFWLSFEFAALLGFNEITSLYVGAILAITSTALTVKVLQQKGLYSRSEVPVLVSVLVLEDIFAVFALTFFSQLQASASLAPVDFLRSLGFSFAVLGFSYFVLYRVFERLLEVLSEDSQETLVFVALGLAAGFGYLAQAVGLSASIGAFLAGSLVASLPRGRLLEQAISPFTLAFSSIFFVSIGMLVNLNSIWSSWWVVLALVAANLAFKFAGTGVATFLFGFSSRSSAFAGLAMLSLGEFSLILAKQGQGAVQGIDLVGVSSLIVFVSTVVFSSGVDRSEDVYRFFRRKIPLPVQSAAKGVAFHLSWLADFGAPGSRLYQRFAAAAGVTRPYFGLLSILTAGVVASQVLLANVTVSFAGVTVPATLAILAGSVLVALFALFKLGGVALDLIGSVKAFSHHLSLSSFLLFLFFISSLLVIPFVLPGIASNLSLHRLVLVVLFVLAMLFLFNIGSKPGYDKGNLLFFKRR